MKELTPHTCSLALDRVTCLSKQVYMGSNCPWLGCCAARGITSGCRLLRSEGETISWFCASNTCEARPVLVVHDDRKAA